MNRALTIRVVFYLVAIGFILVVWQLQAHLSGNFIEPLVTSLNTLQERELDALLGMNSLITTLGTGLLGALGFVLINGRDQYLRPGAKWLAFSSAICVAFSLFFGYVVYLGIISMLENTIFDLDIPAIFWARQAHFYSFLLAVVLFGDFAFHTLQVEDTNESKKHSTGL
jgi:hypothetical protein